MIKLATCLLLCGLMISCAAPSSHVITGEVRAATLASDVAIYTEQPAKFSEIAIVSATNTRSLNAADQAAIDDIINALQSEAAALGANGIIVTSVSEQLITDRVYSFDGVQGSVRDVEKLQKTAQGLAVFIE